MPRRLRRGDFLFGLASSWDSIQYEFGTMAELLVVTLEVPNSSCQGSTMSLAELVVETMVVARIRLTTMVAALERMEWMGIAAVLSIRSYGVEAQIDR